MLNDGTTMEDHAAIYKKRNDDVYYVAMQTISQYILSEKSQCRTVYLTYSNTCALKKKEGREGRRKEDRYWIIYYIPQSISL